MNIYYFINLFFIILFVLSTGLPGALDIFPTYGPQAGGTVLTITAQVPDQYFEPIGVFIGDTLVPFTIK